MALILNNVDFFWSRLQTSARDCRTNIQSHLNVEGDADVNDTEEATGFSLTFTGIPFSTLTDRAGYFTEISTRSVQADLKISRICAAITISKSISHSKHQIVYDTSFS